MGGRIVLPSPSVGSWARASRGEFRALRNSDLARRIPPGSRVAALGAGARELLAECRCDLDNSVALELVAPRLSRSEGLNGQSAPLTVDVVDGDPTSLREGLGGRQFDFAVIPEALAHLEDAQMSLEVLRDHLAPGAGRLLVCTYSAVWRPALKLAEALGLREPFGPESAFSLADLRGLLAVVGCNVRAYGLVMPIPFYVGPQTTKVNAFAARLWGIRHAGLVAWAEAVVAEVPDSNPADAPSCSVICCCRNEVGNIIPSVERIPDWPGDLEIIFVDGASTDGTVEEIEAAIQELSHPGLSIRLIHQLSSSDTGEAAYAPDAMLRLGKGDAVRKGLAAATGDICIIMDPELTVPPEALPKFYDLVRSGRTDFANGTRLIYPMAREAMPLANLLGNKAFGYVFSWLLGYRVTDTLCANKAFRRADYERIASTHAYFGDFDPFGDFELLFGASFLGMRINEIPVRYQPRQAGESKVSVFRHGPILGRMTVIGFMQLKVRPLLKRLRKTIRESVDFA